MRGEVSKFFAILLLAVGLYSPSQAQTPSYSCGIGELSFTTSGDNCYASQGVNWACGTSTCSCGPSGSSCSSLSDAGNSTTPNQNGCYFTCVKRACPAGSTLVGNYCVGGRVPSCPANSTVSAGSCSSGTANNGSRMCTHALNSSSSCASYACTGSYTSGPWFSQHINAPTYACGNPPGAVAGCDTGYVCGSYSNCTVNTCSGTPPCANSHCTVSCASTTTTYSCPAGTTTIDGKCYTGQNFSCTCNSGYIWSGSACVTPAAISISPAPQDLGSVYINQTSSAFSFTVTNSGGVAAVGCSYSVTNTGVYQLNVGNCSNTIAAGGSCTMSVTARPPAAQDYSATLSATCTGTSSSSSLVVHGAIPPAPELTFNTASGHMTGSTFYYPNGAGGKSFDVTVSNGNTATSLDGTGCSFQVTSSSGFSSLSGPSGCGSLAKGASCTATISYSLPAGAASMNLRYSCTNGGNAPSITLYATRYIQADFSGSPGSLTYASPSPAMIDLVPSSDQTGTQNITITNGGDSICYSPTFSASNGNFTVNNVNCGSSIGVGASCQISVYGKPVPTQNPTPAPGPTTTQSRSANIRVSCGTGGNTYVSSLSNDAVTNATLYAQICPTGSIRAANSTCDCNVSPATTFSRPLWKCIVCPFGAILNAAGYCDCPYGYENVNNYCKPKLPSLEFTRDTNDFPVCTSPSYTGALYTRIPVTYGLGVVNVAGPTVPLTNNRTTSTSAATGADITMAATPSPFPYSSPHGSPSPYPLYAYYNQPHCACLGHTNVLSPTPAPGAVTNLPATVTRFHGDTHDVIASRNNLGFPNKLYGLVAVATDGVSDGRLGTSFNAGTSICACPNVNEEMTRVIPGDPQSGMICAPTPSLRDDPNVAFAPFNRARDDAPGASQVFTGATEPKLSGAIVEKVNLPASQAFPNSLKEYQRYIWKCQLGYTLNTSTKTCDIDWADNQCDSTSPIGPSPATWAGTINKKLACCMNQFNSGTTNSSKLKFDCIDNSTANYANFNSLWAAKDPSSAGEQLNAIVLMNTAGRPITGFYTLDGARCNEFSEFSTTAIQPGIMNPVIQSSQQETAGGDSDNLAFTNDGSAIARPTGGAGWTAITTGLGAKATAPNPSAKTLTEITKARRCPILVRAAAVFTCPRNAGGSNSPRFTVNDGTDTRCLAAQNVQVHMRIEQVFKIAGQPPLQTIDTILDRNTAATVNLEQVIRQRNNLAVPASGGCPPGTVPSSGGCRY